MLDASACARVKAKWPVEHGRRWMDGLRWALRSGFSVRMGSHPLMQLMFGGKMGE